MKKCYVKIVVNFYGKLVNYHNLVTIYETFLIRGDFLLKKRKKNTYSLEAISKIWKDLAFLNYNNKEEEDKMI